MITNTSAITKWFNFSWCCGKKAPPTIVAVEKLNDNGCESELQSTSKLTKPPEDDACDVQVGGSVMHQSILNSSMLDETLSAQQSLNKDQLTEIIGNDDEKDQTQSTLHNSVLKSSMLGESL
jgi:hypothetical protein